MENNEISQHEVLIFKVLEANKGKWITNGEIAKSVSPIAERTVRKHTKRLVDLGLLDVAEVFPAHKYRLSEKAMQRNTAYTKRLQNAVEVFGV